MNIYMILSDGNQYRSFSTPHLSPRESLEIDEPFRSGQPLGAAWTPVEVALYEEEGEEAKPLGDFPPFSIPLAISERALRVLLPLIKDNVEVLDLISDVGTFYALNVFFCDCLDHSRSTFERFSDGRIMRVAQYAFQPGCLEGLHIFRIPEEWTYTIVDDAFKQAVEANGLKGLLFYRLPELGAKEG